MICENPYGLYHILKNWPKELCTEDILKTGEAPTKDIDLKRKKGKDCMYVSIHI